MIESTVDQMGFLQAGLEAHAHLVAQSSLTLVTPWTVALQAPLSMGLPRQEYWSGLPFPFPGYLPNQGTEHTSPMSPALAGGFFTTSTTWEAPGSPITMNNIVGLPKSSSWLFCNILWRKPNELFGQPSAFFGKRCL